MLLDITQRPRTKSKSVCLVYECTRKRHCKGMCTIHYMRGYTRIRNNSNPRSLWSMTIGPHTAHQRVSRLWGPASLYPCVECQKPAREWAYDDADPNPIYRSHTDKRGKTSWRLYSRFPEFYMPMCLSCHRGRDLREAARILHEYRLKKYGIAPIRPDGEIDY